MGLSGFVKHVYSYFRKGSRSRSRSRSPSPTKSKAPSTPDRSLGGGHAQPQNEDIGGRYVPVYNKQGRIIRYMEVPGTPIIPDSPYLPAPPSTPTPQQPGLAPAQPFTPTPQQPCLAATPSAQPSTPTPQQPGLASAQPFTPTPQQPSLAATPSAQPFTPTPQEQSTAGTPYAQSQPSEPAGTPSRAWAEKPPGTPGEQSKRDWGGWEEWDGWPDGTFGMDLTWKEWGEEGRMLSHWATYVVGGDRKGSDAAPRWEQGKRSSRRCLGVMKCDNSSCAMVVRPATKPGARYHQLENGCRCGARLIHHKCHVKSRLWFWEGGVHYENQGFHGHVRPTHILRPTRAEAQRFADLVTANPNAGPLELIVGVRGMGGPGDSVADISDVYVNADRVSKDRLKIKRGAGTGADAMIAAFAQFTNEHPGFVVESSLGTETVISMQTGFMRSGLVNQNADLEDGLFGTVNDAAHGWWAERNSLLIVSSVYCADLLCWVPAMMSYSNGASAKHFARHFLALIKSIAEEAEERRMEIVDTLFAGVMDFSEAERQGFIQAFKDFWSVRDDNTRTIAELEIAAKRLLRGCLEHYRAAVTRISRIGGVIPVDMREEFQNRAMGLVKLPNHDAFIKEAALLVRDFPKIESWMNWWTRPDHAMMLFESERQMNIKTWQILSSTTNPQEAMHWKMYSACGRDHKFMEGLYALWNAAVYFERIYEAEMKGSKTRYGNARRWTIMKERIGRTKPTRSPEKAGNKRKRNDGRPPDTVKELLGPKPKKRRVTAAKGDAGEKKRKREESDEEGEEMTEPKPARSKGENPDGREAAAVGPPAKRKREAADVDGEENTKANAAPTKPRTGKRKKGETEGAHGRIPLYRWSDSSCWLDTSLALLHAAFDHNPALRELGEPLDKSSVLSSIYKTYHQRQTLAGTAKDNKELTLTRDHLRRVLKDKRVIRTLTKWDSLFVWFNEAIRKEKGAKTEAEYRARIAFQTLMIPIRYCGGDATTGGPHIEVAPGPELKRYVELNAAEALDKCWRVKDHVPWCKGQDGSLQVLVSSIPILFTMELADETPGRTQRWDIPPTLTPSSEKLAREHGMIYELVGLGLIDLKGTHFIARYKSEDTIYTYDGMKEGGYAVPDVGATVATHMTGRNPTLPEGFVPYMLFYSLRGGPKAQDLFFTERREALMAKHNLHLSGDSLAGPSSLKFVGEGFVEMDPSKRLWMAASRRTTTLEYLTIAKVGPGDGNKEQDNHTSKETGGEANEVREGLAGAQPGDGKSAAKVRQAPDGAESGAGESASEARAAPAGSAQSADGEPESEVRGTPAALGASDVVEEGAMPSSSLPTSAWALNCRCGFKGDGNEGYDADKYGRTIQCHHCEAWSHMACQRDARASDLEENGVFLCDVCDPDLSEYSALAKPPTRKSLRTEIGMRTRAGKPLKQRLRPGRGGLARIGDFWYPVRLIIEVPDGWVVKWWRGNRYTSQEVNPGERSVVARKDLVDSLWKDRRGRRSVRLGMWTRTFDFDEDDLLLQPELTPYTPDVDAALSPAKDVLGAIWEGRLEGLDVPARDWLKSQKKGMHEMVPYSGALTVIERARIGNWFETHITQDRNLTSRKRWVELLPIAHVYTVFIASRITREDLFEQHTAKQKDRKEQVDPNIKFTARDYLDDAWGRQLSELPPKIPDVDLECQRRLEEEMLENSSIAGIAGNEQWGLDAGYHQDGWHPYRDLPYHLRDGTRSGERYDGECEPGQYYIKQPERVKEVVAKPNIRPTPLKRKAPIAEGEGL